MSGRYPRPRWGWLYPVLPLGVVLFWLLDRVYASGIVAAVLIGGVLFVLGAYVEVWLRINTCALEHVTSPDGALIPLYRAREAGPFAAPITKKRVE